MEGAREGWREGVRDGGRKRERECRHGESHITFVYGEPTFGDNRGNLRV